MDEGTGAEPAADEIGELTFEAALAQLEAIVQQLERGDVPLDRSIGLYERGEALRAACQQRLDAAQARIERIVTAADGRAASTAPFDREG